MGSFAVENYGIRGLTNLNKSQIQKRFNQYKKMIRF